MKARMVLPALLAALVPVVVSAQTLTVGAFGVAATYSEGPTRHIGFGGGAQVHVQYQRFGIEAVGFATSLEPAEADPTVVAFKTLEGNVRVQFALTSIVDIEVGYARRRVDPEFAAQDVGLVSVGARLHNQLTSAAGIWVRGAYAPISRFSGGGSASLALEVSFGVTLGPANGKWRGRVEYTFQRIDRSVSETTLPIQFETARLGLEYTLF